MKLTCEVAKIYLILATLLVIVLLSGVAKADDSDREKACALAAEKWLTLVDAGNFADSWDASAKALKVRISRMNWEQKLHAEREPKGICITRKRMASTLRNYPPGSDKEERLIIRFDTSFQNRKYAVERVALTHDKDGQWRVAAYRITPELPDLQSVLVALLFLVVIIGLWLMELNPRNRSCSERRP